MRLLQLQDPATGTLIDLHPRLTVLSRLPDELREAIARTVAGIPLGEATAMRGLLEASGVLLDLTDQTLALLSLGGLELDVVVGPNDLPGAHDDDEEVARGLVEDWPAGMDDDLDACRAAYEAAKGACDDLRAAATALRDGLDDAGRLREAAQAELERAAADIDQRAHEQLEQAREHLGRLEDQLGVRSSEPAAERLARLAERVEELETDLERLTLRDTAAVQTALALLVHPPSPGMVPDTEALALADQFERLQREVDEFEEDLEGEGISLSRAMAELESARAELAVAEAGLVRPVATDADIAELEACHAEVLDLESRSGGRVGRGKVQKQLEEAQAREEVVLRRLGFNTYTEFLLGAAILGVDPAAEERLELARIDSEVREERWARVIAQLENSPAYKALLDELEAVFLAAFDVLGGQEPDDLVGALRAKEVLFEPRSPIEYAGDLWDALEEVGVELGADEVPVEVIQQAAEDFLATQDEARLRRPSLERELADVRRRLAETVEDLEAEEAGEAPEQDEDESDPRLAAARAAVNGADAKLARHLEATRRLPDLEGVVAQAVDKERSLQDELESRTALVDAATLAERVAFDARAARVSVLAASPGVQAQVRELRAADRGGAGPGAEETEFFLLSCLTALRSVGIVGSLPLMLDDTLRHFEFRDSRRAFERIEKLSEAVQLIVVTDDDEAIEWADSLGLQRAVVIDGETDLG